MQMVPFTFSSMEELELGPKWAGVFDELWPHYRVWFLRDGEAPRASYATSVRMLRAHMPELVAAYERVVELAGGGDLAARMLSLYKPPPFLAACSQGAWARDGAAVLARNYDYAPSRCEGIIWSTRLLRPVIGMSDCLWGLLDGMNDAGLAVSLTFGPLGSTMKMCEQDVSSQEQQYLAAIDATASFVIDGDQLTLSDDAGQMLLQFSGA